MLFENKDDVKSFGLFVFIVGPWIIGVIGIVKYLL